MIRRLISPLARLALVASVVLTTGGCCRCWWPGATSSSPAETGPTTGSGAGGGKSSIPGPGHATMASLSIHDFAADPAAPLHGAVMMAERDVFDPLYGDLKQGRLRRFIPHSATSAAAMFNGDIVVEASTGIWSHAPVTLARGERIVAGPVLAMAAAPDGHSLAYARGDENGSVADVQVLTYPEGKPIASFPRIDRPYRLRFSPDGKRLVVGSRKAETVTLIDLATKRVLRFDTDDDVNDAIVLPGDGDVVAYANDGDEAVIHGMASHAKLFSTDRFMREAKGVVLPGSHTHVLTMLRDQNAVAFDPLGSAFFAGGDDNLIWRFHGAPGPSPIMASPVEVNGNVEEILCTHRPAPGQTEASIVVATDTLGIEVITPDGNAQSSLLAMGWSVLSAPIRIALTPDDVVLAALGGSLALFDPAGASVKPSREYPQVPVNWHFSVTEQDTVIATRGATGFLHRVVHTADLADTTTTVVGSIALDPSGIAAFASGTRLVFGASPGGRLRLVYYVPSSGTIEPPLDIADAAPPAMTARRKDGTAIGLLDAAGLVVEVTETPRGARPVGRVRSLLQPTEGLAWDELGQRWIIAGGSGGARPIEAL